MSFSGNKTYLTSIIYCCGQNNINMCVAFPVFNKKDFYIGRIVVIREGKQQLLQSRIYNL